MWSKILIWGEVVSLDTKKRGLFRNQQNYHVMWKSTNIVKRKCNTNHQLINISTKCKNKSINYISSLLSRNKLKINKNNWNIRNIFSSTNKIFSPNFRHLQLLSLFDKFTKYSKIMNNAGWIDSYPQRTTNMRKYPSFYQTKFLKLFVLQKACLSFMKNKLIRSRLDEHS